MDQGNYLHTTDEGLLTRRLLTDMVTSSVVDPDSLNPDLTFQMNPDPDTVHIQSGSNPDPGFYDQKLKKKKYNGKFFFLYFFDQKLQLTYLSLHKGRPSYRKKPSAPEREHPALQTMKFIQFFPFLWVFFPPGSRYRSRNPT
jgi:hypothetical protein